MVGSGNYFLPTINGTVYFDKPLLSYWAMLPFVWVGGLNEAMLRVPATLSGAGTALVLFLIGRRLFGSRAGFFSAAFLLTTPMFLFWSRTASAEVMNTFAILVMFWAFLTSRTENRPGFLVIFYTVGAAASFIKGPVAPAVCLFAVLVWSTTETLVRFQGARFRKSALAGIVCEEFSWILSRPALRGLLCGFLIFGAFLLLPVMLGGSWVSVALMWKENVVRFFSPFDHTDAPHVYAVSILQFSAPWTFLVFCGLWQTKFWNPGMNRRWTVGCASGVLLFFLLSGSRRSYYVLPFIPFLTLIAGKSAVDWMEATRAKMGAMRVGVAATAGLFICIGAALVYVYLSMPEYRHGSELAVALLTLSGAAAAVGLLYKGQRTGALSVLLMVFFVVDIWGFTLGMRLAEKERTLKAFARQAGSVIDRVGDENVALFDQATAELVFYLNRKSALTEVKDIGQIDRFAKEHSAPFLLIDLNDMPQTIGDRIGQIRPVVIQRTGAGAHEERYALIGLSRK